MQGGKGITFEGRHPTWLGTPSLGYPGNSLGAAGTVGHAKTQELTSCEN